MTIETRLGRIRGLDLTDCDAYLGIRFGQPPVGQNRFMAPVASGGWTDTYDATQWPNRAMQGSTLGTMGQVTPGDLSEDCLFLNVYAPPRGRHPKPVMFWIHGGGFTAGSANEYDGRVLASQGDVVVVTINYRLGPFGFLNLEPLDETLRGSASNGIRDMVLALAWVRENIADYGGDSTNVTLFGESAGGKAILSLFATPIADGLFHKAIVHSAGAPSVRPGDKTTVIEEKLGVETSALLDTLRQMSAEGLLGAGLPAGHEVDGTVVTKPFIQALKEGANGIPLIIGTNRTEGTLFTPPDAPDEDVSRYESSLPGAANGVLNGAESSKYIEGLKTAYPDQNAKRLMEIISTDHFRRTAVDVAQSQNTSGTWLYRFDLDTTVEYRGKLMQSAHACEMAFTFNAFADTDCHVFSMHDPSAPGVQALAEQWSGTLSRFAHTGEPNGAGLPEWRPYSPDDRAVMLLNQNSVVIDDPDEVHRGLWSD